MHFYALVPLKENVLTSNIEDSKGCNFRIFQIRDYKEPYLAPHCQDGNQTNVMERKQSNYSLCSVSFRSLIDIQPLLPGSFSFQIPLTLCSEHIPSHSLSLLLIARLRSSYGQIVCQEPVEDISPFVI